MLIGYARVSTNDQTLGQQRGSLKAAGCERIFEEKVPGAKRERPQLALMLDQLRDGDVVTVTRLDRLARSTLNLFDIAERLAAANVGLRSLTEPWADTTSQAGRTVLTIFAGIAEFERSLIHQRTSPGRVAANLKRVRYGRPPALSVEQITEAQKLITEGQSARFVASMLRVHPATLYRYLAK